MMKTNNVTENATVNNDFFTELGKLVFKYYFDGTPFGKMTFVINPEEINEEKVETQKVKAENLKKYGKEGFGIKNANQTKPSSYAMEVVNNIVAEFDTIRMRESNCIGGSKLGYFNCPKAAATIVERYDDEGKLIREALQIMIDAGYHERERGITTEKLELVTRILALHQRRGRAKVKEALTALLQHHSMNSLLVLAKETKLYVQRNDVDMRVLYVESELAKIDGIRNQFR